VSTPSLTLLNPTADCRWQKDSECTVQWDFTERGGRAKPLKEYKIDLYRGGTYLLALNNTKSSTVTKYRWVVPSTLASASDYQIRVTEIHTDTVVMSDEFDIFEKVVVSLNERVPMEDTN